jgi:hypothetical protein
MAVQLGLSAAAASFLRTLTYIATAVKSASDKITEGNERLWISAAARIAAGKVSGFDAVFRLRRAGGA